MYQLLAFFLLIFTLFLKFIYFYKIADGATAGTDRITGTEKIKSKKWKTKIFLLGKLFYTVMLIYYLNLPQNLFLGLSDGTPGKGIYVPVRSFAYEINRYEDWK